jgi:hypothetical protein
MSNESHISGIIIEDRYHPEGPGAAHRWNDAVLARISETDDKFPGLVRSMFAAPRADGRFTSFRGSRGIGVSLHANDVTDFLHLWLPKLEGVLRDLYWTRAFLYIDGGIMGRFQIDYTLDRAALFARRDAIGAKVPISLPLTFTFAISSLDRGSPHPRVLEEVRALPTHDAGGHNRLVSDRTRIERMLKAAHYIQSHIRGRSRADLDTDETFRRALLHAVNEAASEVLYLSNHTTASFPPFMYDSLRDLTRLPGANARFERSPEVDTAVMTSLWSKLQHLDEFTGAMNQILRQLPT